MSNPFETSKEIDPTALFKGSSLEGWTEQDAIDEMLAQREAMGTTATSNNERMQICMTASMMVVCCDRDAQLHSMLEMHYNEMFQRMTMINRMALGLDAL